jgi:hypothetical protein
LEHVVEQSDRGNLLSDTTVMPDGFVASLLAMTPVSFMSS